MNVLLILLLSAALAVIQCLIGGTRLLFAFPAYLLIAGAAILSAFALRRPLSKPSAPAVVATLLLAGYVLGRAFRSPIPYLAWPDAYMAAGCLAVYLLTAVCLTETRHRLWIAGTLFALVIPHVAVGAVQFFHQQGYMLFGFIRPDSSTRASGMLISGNHFAGYLEATAMFALAMAFWSRWRLLGRLGAGAIALACYFGVAISASRGGYISSAFSLIVFAILSLRVISIARPRRTLIAALAMVVVLGGIFAAAIEYGPRNELIRKRTSQNMMRDVRIGNWKAALAQYRLEPWFGTGSGTHLIYGRLFRSPVLQHDPVHAHGDYLELLAEYGIAGAALAAFFLATHLASGLRGAKQLAVHRLAGNPAPPRSDTLALDLGALGAVAALLSHSVVDFNMHIPGNALVFAFIFAILGNPGTARPAVPAWYSLSGLLRLGLPILGIGILFAVIPKMEGEKLAEKARIALRNRDYSRCIPLAKQAIVSEPQNPNPWFYLGEANRITAITLPVPHLRKALFEEAKESYARGLRIFPQDEHALVRYGQALDGLQKFDEAQQAYLEAIRWDPKLGVLYAYYGEHLQLRGEKKAAAEQFFMARRLGAGAAKDGAAEAQALRSLQAIQDDFEKRSGVSSEGNPEE